MFGITGAGVLPHYTMLFGSTQYAKGVAGLRPRVGEGSGKGSRKPAEEEGGGIS